MRLTITLAVLMATQIASAIESRIVADTTEPKATLTRIETWQGASLDLRVFVRQYGGIWTNGTNATLVMSYGTNMTASAMGQATSTNYTAGDGSFLLRAGPFLGGGKYAYLLTLTQNGQTNGLGNGVLDISGTSFLGAGTNWLGPTTINCDLYALAGSNKWATLSDVTGATDTVARATAEAAASTAVVALATAQAASNVAAAAATPAQATNAAQAVAAAGYLPLSGGQFNTVSALTMNMDIGQTWADSYGFSLRRLGEPGYDKCGLWWNDVNGWWYFWINKNPEGVEQDANIVFETPDAAGTEFVAYRSWVTANTLAPGSAPTFAQATNIADNAAAGRVATNDARYLAALTNAAAFDAAGSSAAVTNGAATGTNTTGTVFANGIARSVGTNTPWTSSCVLTSAIPGPGCTDLGSGAAVTLSGSTVSYTANPATAYTVAVTAAAPRYVYALQIVSTNACTLASGLSLQGSWTITGTNILAIVPCTGNVWRVYGRGL